MTTPFYRALESRIAALGGMHNAHLHLDRYGTLDDRYLAAQDHRILQSSHVSLHKKHALLADLHAGPAFEPDDLRRRVDEALDTMVQVGTRRADTLVDTTADCVGLTALTTMRQIQRARKGQFELRLGAYSPFGFRDDEPARWQLLEAAAEQADFLAALPEADDRNEYPEHIGFEEHCRRFLELAERRGCELHVHTDQRNEPGERGTERLLQVMQSRGARPTSGEPSVWAVHMISPTTYEEDRFRALTEGLLEHNVGVIVCPSAALGMRQLRPLRTPTANSIPRVLELLDQGVRVRLASDNIADICSPSTTADLVDEVFVLSAAIRYYDVEVLARLACGQPLSADERARVKDHLERDAAEVARMIDASLDQAHP